MGSIPIARSNSRNATHFLMLSKLTVSNYAIIESAEAGFGPGLNVITGETGAGKSVLMGALGFVLGARESTGTVRDGAREAEVAAVFGKRELRRTLTASGRSRAWIDGESVSLVELREEGAKLVDIHGPRANQKLLEESFQRGTIDGFDRECAALAAEYTLAWKDFCSAKESLRAIESDEYDEDAADLLRYQVDELEAAAICADDDDIEERHSDAAHASETVADAGEITEAIGGDRGAAETLIALQPKFAAIARHAPEAAEWAETAESITRELQELSRTIADAATKIDVDEREFERLDERLGVVNRIRRKYLKSGLGEGVSFSSAIAAILEKKKAKLSAMENRDVALAEAKGKLAIAEKNTENAASLLAAARAKAGARFAKAVTKELRDLGFLQAVFRVEISPSGVLSPSGADTVKYMFEPNLGESARELRQIASSGEIARVMLAIKSVLCEDLEGTTLVFDEIDANIGGETGRKVGERLRDLAKRGQVLAITHLPQSAAYGEHHFTVAKRVEGGRTVSGISQVCGKARIAELARLFGAGEDEKAAWAHAGEILRKAETWTK